VELSLGSRDSVSSGLTRTIRDLSPDPTVRNKPIKDTPQRPSLLEESSSGSTVKHSKNGRPTYVALPSPQSFSIDENPTSSTGISQSAHSRSSSELGFEPGMEVLVIDDDSITRTLMTRLLNRLGCNVSTAENGEVALEMILGVPSMTPSSDSSNRSNPILERRDSETNTRVKYAIAFLDNQMPVLSGLATVTKLRRLGRQDFIVGVTGKTGLKRSRFTSFIVPSPRECSSFRPAGISRSWC
jgi:osomolarity two-component system sensor histidine kinase SLN1